MPDKFMFFFAIPSFKSITAPATFGDDIEVPLIAPCSPLPKVEYISPPGADISGLSSKFGVGPHEEKLLISPPFLLSTNPLFSCNLNLLSPFSILEINIFPLLGPIVINGIIIVES